MSRNSTIKRGFLLGLFVVLMNSGFAWSQNCNATLTVEKNRNVKSAYQDDPATFRMVLTNTTAGSVTYIINTKNLEQSCANDIHRTSAPNVALNVAVRSTTSAGPVVDAITLSPGETRKFNIEVGVPQNTPKDRWSCIEVSAQGKNCSQPAASTTLRVYVPENSDG